MSSRVALERPSTTASLSQQSHVPAQSRLRSAVTYIPQASAQNRFSRPTLFISCSSRSSSVSSSSSSGDHSMDDVAPRSSSTSLAQSISPPSLQCAKTRRPLPQIPPSSQPNSSTGKNFPGSSPSPVGSPSSASSRPLRALPCIPPPSPKTQPSIAAGFLIQPPPRNVSLQPLLLTSKPLPSSSTASTLLDSPTPPPTQLRSATSLRDVGKGNSTSVFAHAAKRTHNRPSTADSNTKASSSRLPPVRIQTGSPPSNPCSSSASSSQTHTPSTSKLPPMRSRAGSASPSPNLISTFSPQGRTASTSKYPPVRIRTGSIASSNPSSTSASSSQTQIALTSKPPLARIRTDSTSSYTASTSQTQTNRPKLRLQTNINATTVPPPMPLQTQPSKPTERSRPIARRSSLDSLTIRSSSLMYPGQGLSPLVPKKAKIRRIPRKPPPPLVYQLVPSMQNPLFKVSVMSSKSTKLQTSTGLMAGAVSSNDYVEELSPMEFKAPFGSGSGDDDYDRNVQVKTMRHSATTSDARRRQPQSPALPRPTAEEVSFRRMSKIRRRLGDKAMQELDVDEGVGVGRVILSEGDDDDSLSDENVPSYGEEDEEDASTESRMIFEANEDEEEDEFDDRPRPLRRLRIPPRNESSKTPISQTEEKSEAGTMTRSRRQFPVHGSSLSDRSLRTESIKKQFSRRWFKDKGGKRWEERDVHEVIGALRRL